MAGAVPPVTDAGASTAPVVRVAHVDKQYETAAGPQPVLRDVNLEIAAGEFVAVLGPSGSGKSTFMNIVGCLDTATAGTYEIGGRDTARLDADALARLRNRFIGFVFQGFNLLPRASLAENVALPLVYAGVPRREREDRARELLAKVGLPDLGDRRPSQISGGQQQRVAIARALANRPRLLLADEPTGNLDTATSHEIMGLFAALNADEGITIVLVTHEHDVAAYARRHVTFLDGRIVRDEPFVPQPQANPAEHATP
jgi:putative ABC transport system ATP-binding protein